MRVSFVLLSLASMASLASAVLFNQQPAAPWAPRILQGWAFPSSAFTYTTTAGSSATAAASTSNVIAWGGGVYNDTYLSTDSGKSWTLVGGTAASINTATGKVQYTTSPHPATFNCDDADCAKVYDAKNNIYYVVDQFAVWTSNDGLTWSTVGGTEFAGRQSSFALLDSSSDLFVIGGQNTTGSLYENDVWESANQGKSFTQQSYAPWSQRDSQNGWSYTAPALGGKSILYAIGGHAQVENTRPNEVWVSSDSGASWRLLGLGAFPGRDHFGAAITSTGIMLVVGGKLQATNALGSHLGTNDIWASMDGGATFGFCGNAEWPVRQDHRVAIDSNDYLYVSGGTSINQTGPTVTLNDVWQSANSWGSTAFVATQCNLVVPACGVGLRCWPNATTLTMAMTTGGALYPTATPANYSCPCVATSSSSTGTNSGGSSGGGGGGGGGGTSGAVATAQLSLAAVVLALLSVLVSL